MSFSVPNKEIGRLKEMYEQELLKTLDRLAHIEAILSQLNGFQPASTSQTLTEKSPEIKAVKKPVAQKSKKRGPRSVWGNFVLKRLKDLDKPLTYNELVEEAMRFSNVGPEKEKSIRQSIINTTFKLRTAEGDIDTFSMGNRIKYLALKEWFDEHGQIKAEYGKKTSKSAPKKTSRKRKTKK